MKKKLEEEENIFMIESIRNNLNILYERRQEIIDRNKRTKEFIKNLRMMWS